jgi:hypothetical protein
VAPPAAQHAFYRKLFVLLFGIWLAQARGSNA